MDHNHETASIWKTYPTGCVGSRNMRGGFESKRQRRLTSGHCKGDLAIAADAHKDGERGDRGDDAWPPRNVTVGKSTAEERQ